MTTETNQPTAEQLKARSEAMKAAFHREWANTLQSKAAALSGLPQSALAYEIAWHAYRAGRESVSHGR